MKTLYLLMILMLFVGITVVGCGDGASTSTSPDESPEIQLVKGTQELCPIMDKPIVEDSFVDYEGKRIYFCCPGCDAKFSEDPQKYIKEMEDAGVVLTEIVGMQLSSLETSTVLCPGCGQVKGSENCCDASAEVCPDCGLAQGSPACCKGFDFSNGAVKLCEGCGQVKGSELCCVEGAELCPGCGKVKGSPGCCIIK